MPYGGSGGGYSGGGVGMGTGSTPQKKKPQSWDDLGGLENEFKQDVLQGANNLPGAQGVRAGIKSVTDPWAGQSGYDPSQPMYDPTRADVDRGRVRQLGTQQSEYNEWLKNAAMGKGPSVAQAQLSQGRDAAIAAAASQAAAARGGNAALANRSAVDAGANLNMQAARDAAALRASEQMGYANQWGQGLQAQRAGDLTARGQTIDEQKAQLAAETAYQQNKAQIAAGNAERAQGIFGEVLGSTGGGVMKNLPVISDQSAKMDIDSPGEAKQGIELHNPGVPAIRTGGGMTPAPQPTAYSDQFAAIGKAYDEGQLGKTAQEQADEAETRRNQIQGIGQGMSNAKNDHGVGLITSILGMLSDEKAKTGIVDKARAAQSAAKAAMREHVSRGPVGLLTDYGRQATGDTAKRAAERVVGWLQPEKMQTGAVEGARYGTERASGSAAVKRMSPEEQRMAVLATRGPRGEPGSDDDVRTYARKVAEWRANQAAAKAAESDAWQEQRRYGEGERARLAMKDRLGVDSDKDTKRENVALRAALRAGTPASGELRGGTERLERDFAQLPDKEWQYRPEFADRANERMGLPPTARFGDVRKSSPMAQDFEKVPATAGVVAIDPETGMRKLDGGQLAATTAAATGAVARHALSLEERMRRLEGRGNPNPAQDSGAGVTPEEWEQVRRGLRGL